MRGNPQRGVLTPFLPHHMFQRGSPRMRTLVSMFSVEAVSEKLAVAIMAARRSRDWLGRT
jgi:hypothetical protein